MREVETYSTITRSLLRMAESVQGPARDPGGDGGDQRPLEAGVLPLEAATFETWLVNARDVEHLSGRPMTDRLAPV
jgi:transposase